jgi:hypothetical protein
LKATFASTSAGPLGVIAPPAGQLAGAGFEFHVPIVPLHSNRQDAADGRPAIRRALILLAAKALLAARQGVKDDPRVGDIDIGVGVAAGSLTLAVVAAKEAQLTNGQRVFDVQEPGLGNVAGNADSSGGGL